VWLVRKLLVGPWRLVLARTRDTRIALSGIGGLGHLAVQYAAKLGYRVTVFSSSANKEAEAKALGDCESEPFVLSCREYSIDSPLIGATAFVLTNTPEQLKQAESTIDFLMVTSSGQLDWDAYVKILK